jgi:hypothetical protein
MLSCLLPDLHLEIKCRVLGDRSLSEMFVVLLVQMFSKVLERIGFQVTFDRFVTVVVLLRRIPL